MYQLKPILVLLVCSSLYCAVVYGADDAAKAPADAGKDAADECAKDGFFVVEDDCSRFYRCVAGTRFNFDCDDGLKFDSKLQVCVWGNQIDCVSKPRPTKEPVASTTKA